MSKGPTVEQRPRTRQIKALRAEIERLQLCVTEWRALHAELALKLDASEMKKDALRAEVAMARAVLDSWTKARAKL